MPHRRSGHATRAAIHDAAMDAFIAYGYEGTSLEGIAEKLGMTRQAVLYHFGSKEELLRSVVVPGLEAINETWDSLAVSDPPSRHEQQHVLTVIIDTLCEHRGVVAVLTRFATQTLVASIIPALVELNEKALRLMGGSAVETDPLLRIRVVAAFGAIGGVMTSRLDVPLSTRAERAELAKGCLAMLAREATDGRRPQPSPEQTHKLGAAHPVFARDGNR